MSSARALFKIVLKIWIEEVFKMPIFGPVWALGPKKGGTYKIKI